MRAAILMLFAAGAFAFAAGPGLSGGPDALSSEIVQETNRVRQMYGLTGIVDDPQLRDTASRHSWNMAENAFWGHVDPQGRTPSKRVSEEDASFKGSVAENLWKCEHCEQLSPEEMPRQVVAAWLNSPGHRENLLNSQLTHAGIGISIRNGTIHVTQLLASRFSSCQQPDPVRPEDGLRFESEWEHGVFAERADREFPRIPNVGCSPVPDQHEADYGHLFPLED
jgi:hypothetical protein